MSFFGNIAANKALKAHQKGNYAEAQTLYREAFEKGMTTPSLMLNFINLLVRDGKFDEALTVIKRMEKNGGLTEKDRLNMHIQYAIILWRKGHLDHAIEILEEDMKRIKNGNLYGVLGYLLIEQGNAKKAQEFNQAALEYDDADPIFLENMAQVYYRMLGDKATAKSYFEKVIQYKPTAIDTNYFLALYDIEDGNAEEARKKLTISKEGRFTQLNYATPSMIDEKLSELS